VSFLFETFAVEKRVRKHETGSFIPFFR